MVTKTVYLQDNEEMFNVFGPQDENLRLIEHEFDVSMATYGNTLIIKGNKVKVSQAYKMIQELLNQIRRGYRVDRNGFRRMLQHGAAPAVAAPEKQPERVVAIPEEEDDVICHTIKGKKLVPRSKTQRKYVTAIRKYDMVFGIGPAGTGKTYLAVAMAIAALRNEKVSRIVLTRPVVEAGEKLGFLPGDLYEKVDPYLRPLYDAFYEIMGAEEFHHLRDEGVIEIVPLAYMRGRTLNDAFIVLDEAQNTNNEQMKMFLTRIGFETKTVIVGDITQIDLQNKRASGLVQIRHILKDVQVIKFIYFTGHDVVRHKLVKRIIHAYEEYERSSASPIRKEESAADS